MGMHGAGTGIFQEPVRGMLKMIKKKRYGGLILFLALFLALRPASALAVHAAETDRIPGRMTEAAQLVSEERFVPARFGPARPFSVKSDSVKADPVKSANVSLVSVRPVSASAVSASPVPERIDPFGKIKGKAFRDPPEQGGLMMPSGHDNPDEEKTSKKKSKKNFEIPQFIKDYHFDADAEKQKLAEAISKLDELGFSPEKMAERLWDIISRRENREKIGKAAEDLKENTGKLIEKASGAGTDTGSGNEGSGKETSDKENSGKNDSGKDDSGKDDSGKDDSDKGGSRQDKSQKEGSGTEESGTDESPKVESQKGEPQKEEAQKEESQKEESKKEEAQKEESGKNDSGDSGSGKDSSVKVRKSEDTPLYERAAGGVDRVKEKVREEASKKVDEAIDKAAEAAADYAVKEINETAEKVKEEVR